MLSSLMEVLTLRALCPADALQEALTIHGDYIPKEK